MAAPALLRDAKVTLAADQEWRFEVDHGSQGIVTLKCGLAEIFGTELVVERRYTFSGVKLAVFTWHGCTLEVEGAFAHQYTAFETPMLALLQFHDELEQRRHAALANSSQGPRIMVAGSADCGKTSLCRILANYAARRGHVVTLVDLDPAAPLFSVPGTVAAAAWSSPWDLENSTEYTAPLVFWVGSAEASNRLSAFRHEVGALGSVLEKIHAERVGAEMAGMIVNTSGWVDGDGYEALMHSVDALAIDTVVVIDNDRLYSRLSAQFQHKDIAVRRMPKSGGVVVRSKAYRHESRMDSFRRYFYGIGGLLCPHSTVIPFSSVTLVSIEEAPMPSADTLPIGVKVPRRGVRAVVHGANQWPTLVRSILGVLYASSADEADILAANVAGVVYVTHVDMDGQKATVLAPSPALLPSQFLACSDIKWLQSAR